MSSKYNKQYQEIKRCFGKTVIVSATLYRSRRFNVREWVRVQRPTFSALCVGVRYLQNGRMEQEITEGFPIADSYFVETMDRFPAMLVVRKPSLLPELVPYDGYMCLQEL